MAQTSDSINNTIPSNLSNKLITTDALWNILSEMTIEIYNNIPQPETVDISGKADILNPIFEGNIALGTSNNLTRGYSLAVGTNNLIQADNSAAIGHSNYITQSNSFATGIESVAMGKQSFASGGLTESISISVTAINNDVVTLSEGYSWIKPGQILTQSDSGNSKSYLITNYNANQKKIAVNKAITSSNLTGWIITRGCIAFGMASHAEGSRSRASGDYSHAEGQDTLSSADGAHAEGSDTQATGGASHAEGAHTIASAFNAHAEGYNTTASNQNAHAEGSHAQATGLDSHAEGWKTSAEGDAAHAEGKETHALEDSTHAEGQGTIAAGKYSHVFGRYNIEDTLPKWTPNTLYKVGDKVNANSAVYGAPTYFNYKCIQDHTSANTFTNDSVSTVWEKMPASNYVEIVGNGSADDARSNARTLDWDGNEWLAGNITINGGSLTLHDQDGDVTITAAQLRSLLATLQ